MKLSHITIRKNSDGTKRYYFRRRGQPLVRLPDDAMSPEFMRAYNTHLSWHTPVKTERIGTFEWLCDEYMSTVDFRSKSTNTRNQRTRVLINMCQEFIDPDYPETFGQEKVRYFTRQHIVTLMERKSDKRHAANIRLNTLNLIFKMGAARGYVDHNPCQGVERFSINSDRHTPATDEDITKFQEYHVQNPAALFALFLAMKTGARASDLRTLGRQHIRDNVLSFHTQKTNRLCELTLESDLINILKSRPGTTFIVRPDGYPYNSEKTMSTRFSNWFKQAGITNVTVHGIRKWLAIKMAENGANEFELMAWFGWSDPKEARPYVERVNRLKLAEKAGQKVKCVTRYTK